MKCLTPLHLLLFLLSAVAPALPAPQLTVKHRQDQVLISWPVAASDWVLEQTPQLNAAVSWTEVAPASYQVTSTNIFVATTSPAGSMFYHLRQVTPSLAIPGLSGAWTLDEAAGQTASDSSGNGNVVLMTNVAWTVGRIGLGAVWFNGLPANAGGSRAWISNSNYSVLPISGQPFSVSLWFNPDVLTNGWRGLIGNDANGTNGWHLALHNSGPGTNDLVFAAAGPATLNVTGRKLLLPGQWHELTATYDGNEGIIYLDSELLGRGTGTLLANNQPIYFGGGVGGLDSFPAAIDQLRIYTNSLTQEQISLTGQWHFDENGGTFITDSGIHGHSARLSNLAGWATGKGGSGINLSNSTVRIANDSQDVLPPTGGSFSLSCWLYPNSAPAGWSGLMSCADGTNTGWSLAFFGGPGQTGVRFWSTDSGGTLDLFASMSLDPGVWNKLDLTYNGGIATAYLNGRKLNSDNGGIQGSKAPLIVGTAPGMTNFNGVIDDLKIYSRERGEAEVGPVAKVMWETVLINTTTNLSLQGFGPDGKPLTYSIVDTITPTNGTLSHASGSSTVTYTAGPNKGPDAFTYTVTDGEFSSPPTTVVLSVVQPHWLSPSGGSAPPLDGTSPNKAWVAGPSDALDAIWHTNQYYDCFFYAPGEYQTTGWKYGARGTSNPGCKHIGSGSDGSNQTVVKLVNNWEAWNEGFIFGSEDISKHSHAFEVHDLVLDCNADNNPKYFQGEPIWISIPLFTNANVSKITLHWNQSQIPSNGRVPNTGSTSWYLGPAQVFSICTRVPGTTDYVTNCSSITSTGTVDTVAVGAYTDEVVVRLERRAPGVDFYALSEIELTGAGISLPSAIIPAAGKSTLDTNSASYSILNAVDGNDGTVWASGSEDQVRIALPLQSGTAVSQLTLSWNCQTIAGTGRLGPAAEYQIQARDSDTGQYYSVPFVRQQRTTNGLQTIILGGPSSPTNVITDEIVILLTSKELGVNFYSLREIVLLNGAGPVPLKIPTALNSLYHVLRAFDGDSQTQWASGTQGMIGAIDVIGNNIKFTHLRVMGFGTKPWRECFALGVRTPPIYWTPVHFGNVLVEDCIFNQPATNNADGVTVVTLLGFPPHTLTNAVIRRCTVAGVRPYFTTSTAFTPIFAENCMASNCTYGVYFEPEKGQIEVVNPVVLRSNLFLNADRALSIAFHAGTRFDALTCIGNEIVLPGGVGWGFATCDVCDAGPSGTLTNVTVLNNIIRYSDWSLQPANADVALQYSDMQNAVFGNNVVMLGTTDALRLRPCPAGFIPPPVQKETCDFLVLPPPPPPTYPPCLDVPPPGYRRGWFQNRDLLGRLLNIRYSNNSVDGLATQQQWP